MENVFSSALQKIADALDGEKINYMIVGGFAISYHNRSRTTNDIDIVLQIQPEQVTGILKHFPRWKDFDEFFQADVANGMVFNLTNYDSGIRYDFMTYQDNEYNRTAFQRRIKVEFWGVSCYLSTKEDLCISKLKWYNISPSDKQIEDVKFLLLDKNLDKSYIQKWADKLNLNTHGLLG